MDQKSDAIWRAELASGVFGTVGAATSVATVIGSARLNYYYQTVSRADSVLGRLARVNVWGGTVAAWSGFFSAGADGLKQFLQIMEARDRGESWAGSGITLLGDSMIFAASGRIGFTGSRGLYHILIKQTAGVTWASVNLSLIHI